MDETLARRPRSLSAMPGPEALLAAPALLALVLLISAPWRRLDSSSLPPSLRQELEQRQLDVSRLGAPRAGLRPVLAAGPLGCAELNGATELGLVGSGITKDVRRAALQPGGREIALKVVRRAAGGDVSRCVQRYGHAGGCRRLASYKLLKESLLLQSLDHPGIIQFLGQCYSDGGLDHEMKVVTAVELGRPLEMIKLLQTPWEERFKICLDLVELLFYLANSPLGSIAVLDFQPKQFVMVNGILKLTDLDDVSPEELSCHSDEECRVEFPAKSFSLKCAAHGKCEGINEKRNLFNAYRYFFMYLLPYSAPVPLQHLLKDILNATGDLRYGTNETLRAFQKVLHLYKSGLYLQKNSSYLKDYKVIKGLHSIAAEDYRCWPSYSHLGCMLSIHNAEEAAAICNSHPQCQHFTITPQRTWTGRPLALFQSNLTNLTPGGNTVVYLKQSAAFRGSL
uniref:Protein kinase domain-containing protein n=1 Tax=Salvator merianae TaxID=96440 RepID=A0A8D0C0S6_SALMN